MRAARIAGASTIIAVDVKPKKLEYARTFGAMHAVLADASDEELLGYRLDCFRLTAPSSLGRAPQVVFPGRHGDALFAGSVLGPIGRDEALIEIVGRLARGGGRVSV